MLKRTWAEVNLDHLAHNVAVLRGPLPAKTRFLGVVKADAYGHGAVPVARELQRLGAEYLAVSNLEEALQLRRAEVTLPILILGYTPPEYAPEEARLGITQEVHSLEYARELSGALRTGEAVLTVHIKLDTGMTRLGFFAYGSPESEGEILEAAALPNLDPEGVFMHFAVSDTPAEAEYTKMQYSRFRSMITALEQHGLHFRIVHCCNSGAAIAWPQYAEDMVRPGIATYGLPPSPELRGAADLRPLMSLKTTIAAVRTVRADTTISYGRTYRTEGDRRIAVCPIGYADGLPRRLSGKVEFLVRGKAVPVTGRICMDMCMIDVTEVPDIRVGDTVTVIGRDGSLEITWDEWADKLGTISYELCCGISKRVPRIYLRDGKTADTLQYII